MTVVSKPVGAQQSLGFEARPALRERKYQSNGDVARSRRPPSSSPAEAYTKQLQLPEERIRISESPSPRLSPGPDMVISREPTLRDFQLLDDARDNQHGLSVEQSPPASGSASFERIVDRNQGPTERKQEPLSAERVYSPMKNPASQSLPLHTRNSSSVTVPVSNAASGMLSLMRTCRGRINGHVFFRLDSKDLWSSSFCSITESGSLKSQVEGAETLLATLVPNLRGCKVFAVYDDDSRCSVLQVSSVDMAGSFQLRPSQKDLFNAWFAAILCWQPVLKGNNLQRRVTKPFLQRLIGFRYDREARDSIVEVNRRRHTRSSSTESDPAVVKSCVATCLEERSEGPSSSTSSSASSMQSFNDSSHVISAQPDLSAIPISCALREGGQFQVAHPNNSRSKSFTLQMGDFPHSAIQRIDRSVFDADNVLGLYPQYTSPSVFCSRLRPLFIQFGSADQLSVWFALLRLFAMPEIYGALDSSETDDYSLEEALPRNDTQAAAGRFRVSTTCTLAVKRVDFHANVNSPWSQSQPDGQNESFSDIASAPPTKFYTEIIMDQQLRARTSLSSFANGHTWKDEFVLTDMPSVHPVFILRIKKKAEPQAYQGTNHSTSSRSPTLKSFARSSRRLEVESPMLCEDSMIGEAVLDTAELRASEMTGKTLPLLSGSAALGVIEVGIKRADRLVLMSQDYDQVLTLLEDFTNNLTIRIWQHIPSALLELAEKFLDIFQASNRALDWLVHLVTEEIDVGVRKPVTVKIESKSPSTSLKQPHDDLAVEDNTQHMNHHDSDVSLLFRANTLLTKSLDAFMRRVGQQYLEDTIGQKLKEVMHNELDYEVNPSKVIPANGVDIQWNWRHLLDLTASIWRSIRESASKCPLQIKLILSHIRTTAQARYGSVSHSAFGLVQGLPNVRAHRAFVLVAKALQGLANMTTLGTKEPWMSPMDAFCSSNRGQLKEFVDEICDIVPDGPDRRNFEAHTSRPLTRDSMEILEDPSAQGLVEANHDRVSLLHLMDRPSRLAGLVELWLAKTSATKAQGSSMDAKSKFAARTPPMDRSLTHFDRVCKDLDRRKDSYREMADTSNMRESNVSSRWVTIAERMEATPGNFWTWLGPQRSGTEKQQEDWDRSKRERGRAKPDNTSKRSTRTGFRLRRGSSSGSGYSGESNQRPKKKSSPNRAPEEQALRKLGWIM
ncbi:MAG: hypothetical protein M1828_007449 [Chrysothrix sp. TS-e1954]|nr:MAG: hypothetical protein M1828_007449 [Chrysothrix sp. TS-e1954]